MFHCFFNESKGTTFPVKTQIFSTNRPFTSTNWRSKLIYPYIPSINVPPHNPSLRNLRRWICVIPPSSFLVRSGVIEMTYLG